MDLNITWGDLARDCGGNLLRGNSSDRIHAISTDSRKVEPGDVFLALRGDRFDAHQFLDERLAKLCAGWIVARTNALPKTLPPHVIATQDTRLALAALATRHRQRFSIPVVGITGSNGKTTVKEMIRAILAHAGPVCGNAGNFNNEIGLPLSILELQPSHRYAVFEMGASRPGDIRTLSRIAQPTMGVLTNIAPAHIEFLGDLEGVYRTKTELVEELGPQAPVALNADDPYLARLLPDLGSRAVTFGSGPQTQVRALKGTPGIIELSIRGEKIAAQGEGFGLIHRLNAAAAAAAALVLDTDLQTIRRGLEDFRPAPLRFQPRKHPSGAWLVVDAYNANPASMRAGIETFLETACFFRQPLASGTPRASAAAERRADKPPQCVVVLGDMKELGPSSRRLHRELGQWLGSLPLACAYLIGDDMADAAAGLKASGARFPFHHRTSAGPIAADLRAWLKKGTAIYMKASRAMHLEDLAAEL